MIEMESKGIQFKLDAESNNLLTAAAKASGRSKKSEAQLRLSDHLSHLQN